MSLCTDTPSLAYINKTLILTIYERIKSICCLALESSGLWSRLCIVNTSYTMYMHEFCSLRTFVERENVNNRHKSTCPTKNYYLR